jgi:hypothetical protein
MYEPLLLIHSWTRWIVLIGLIFLFIRSLQGWIKQSEWTEGHTTFVWGVDQAFGYQVLFGILIWLALSPFSKAGFAQPGEIMTNPLLFFWTLRHPLTMISALGFFQIAKVRARRKPESREKFKLMTLATGTLLILIATAIPWPGLYYGRALFRWPT